MKLLGLVIGIVLPAASASSIAAQTSLVSHWVMAPEHVRGARLLDRAGRNHARIEGRRRILAGPGGGSMPFTSKADRLVVADDIRRAERLPKRAITVEAWVAVDKPQRWGGIVSLLQDNGDFEKGWLLGYTGSKFCFALASKGADDGNGKLTYLQAEQSFVPGRWHHVAGVYDGKEMTLWIDGAVAARSRAQSGDILYPADTVFELGAYRDRNENYPLIGALAEVRLLGRALDGAAIRARFDARQAEMRAVATATEVVWKRGQPLASVRPPRGPLTIEALFSVRDARRGTTILAAGAPDGSAGFALEVRGRRVLFTIASQKGTRVGTALAADVLLRPFGTYHVVATWSGELQRLHVDGKLCGTARGEFGDLRLPAKPLLRTVAAQAPAIVLHGATLLRGAYGDRDVAERWQRARKRVAKPLELTVGPHARFTSPATAEVRWETEQPMTCALEVVTPGGATRRIESKGTSHAAVVSGLSRDRLVDYRILGADGRLATEPFVLDPEFNYAPATAERTGAWPPAEQANAARRLLERAGVERGWCLVSGEGAAGLAAALATARPIEVIVVEASASRVAAARKHLAAAGLYGRHVTVHHGKLDELPYGDWFANLVVACSSVTRAELAELQRVLRPSGGVLMLRDGPRGEGWKTVVHGDAKWSLQRRPALAGAGEWTHQYGGTANTSSSGDRRVRGGMELQWFGRPGPRPMLDRGCRSPAPLFAGGRLYVQGDRRLFGIDAYNGTILWTREIQDLRRVNVPRDCSNTAAHGDDLWVAVRDRLWRIDGQSGDVAGTLPVPRDTERIEPQGPAAWGFVARTDKSLLGTITLAAAQYTAAENGEWYDGTGKEAEYVAGYSLFALDPESHRVLWSRGKGLIVHPTITIHGGRVFFVEDRNPPGYTRKHGRFAGLAGRLVHLVALELATGKVVWEREHDFSKCSRCIYVSAADDTVIVCGTSTRYDLWAFDAATGKPRWAHHHAWTRDQHGGAIQHPVIVGKTVYAEMKAVHLETGAVLRSDLPKRRGCGTMSASASAIFYRHYHHGMWDLETDERKQWLGIRSGCWLSILPAGGLMLAPESSSGCSCANPLQTSVVYRPVGDR